MADYCADEQTFPSTLCTPSAGGGCAAGRRAALPRADPRHSRASLGQAQEPGAGEGAGSGGQFEWTPGQSELRAPPGTFGRMQIHNRVKGIGKRRVILRGTIRADECPCPSIFTKRIRTSRCSPAVCSRRRRTPRRSAPSWTRVRAVSRVLLCSWCFSESRRFVFLLNV